MKREVIVNPVFISSFFIVLITGGFVFAHHPNEGTLDLQDLVREALANSQELRAQTQQLEIAASEAKAARSGYLPEVSIEGGPLTTKFDNERNADTALYGKAEWNIYRGGRDSARVDIKNLEAVLADKRAIEVRARTEREVARLYYEMLFLTEGTALKEKALLMNDEQMKLARVKRQSGFTSNADVLEFELREATIKSDLRSILQQKEEKSRELSVLLGRNETSNNLSVRGHLAKDTLQVDRKKILSVLERTNPDLVEAQVEQQVAEKEKTIAKSEFLPKVDVEGRFGKIANEERVFSEKDNYSVFLKVKIPLFSGFSTIHEVGAANAKSVQREAWLNHRTLSAKAGAENLFSQLDSIRERLDLEEKTLQRSEDYYKLTLAEYRRGVKNSPDMVGAAERLLDARIRNLEFRRDLYLTKLRILGLTGLAR